MVKHKILPFPDATVGRVLGLVEVLYSYGGTVKVSFLSEELRMPMDELGAAIDMAELFNLVKVNDGIVTLTLYGEAMTLGTIEDKKRILRKKVGNIEPFKTAISIMKKASPEGIKEEDMFLMLGKKYPIQDKERFHKLFIGWGTYTGIFEYDGENRVFKKASQQEPSK